MNRVKDRLGLLRPLGVCPVLHSLQTNIFSLLSPYLSSPNQTLNIAISVPPSKLSIPGVLLLNIVQFCHNPLFAEDSTRIVSLTRYKDNSGLKHEFIILEAGTFEANEVWVRIDRAATLESGPTAGSILSTLPAKDSVGANSLLPNKEVLMRALPILLFTDSDSQVTQ